MRELRPQGIPALLFMTAILVGEVGVVLQLNFNVIKEEGAVMTSFLQTALGTLLLWIVVWAVPGLRQPDLRVGWPQWWRATAIGASSVMSLVAGREAMTTMPYGTVVSLAFVFGPMAAAGFRIIRARMWRALAWPALAAASVYLLVDGLQSGDLKGIMLIGVVAVAYHVYATTTSALSKEELNTVATMARLPTVIFLTAMLFLTPEGPTALAHVSLQAWWVCTLSGAVGVVALLLVNWAWARGMSVSTHAGTKPFDNLVALLESLFFGQSPTQANWIGAGLVIVSEVGVTRAQVPDRKEPSMFSMWMDDLPARIARYWTRVTRWMHDLLARIAWYRKRVTRWMHGIPARIAPYRTRVTRVWRRDRPKG
jgi:drug/metabolite transporter (DMT)-like permease